MTFKVRVIEINIGHPWGILDVTWLVNSVLLRAYGELLKLHNILRQSPRLVTENVVNHAELLIQVRRLHDCW